LDDAIYLSSIGIHTRLDGGGYRLTFPSKKSGQQQFQIFHPIRKDVGAAIERTIISHAYLSTGGHRRVGL
jgi:stage V sporulation protein G